MDKTYRINLDIGSKEPQQTNIIVCSGDSGIRLEIEVTGIDTTNIPAKLVFKNQKGESYETAQFLKTGTRYIYTLLGNEISYPGTVVADLKLIESTKRISSTKFTFMVDQDTLNDSPIQSGAYSAPLDVAIDRAITAAKNAEDVVAGLFPIANNFTTTVPGYALDARKGKELNDNLAVQTYEPTLNPVVASLLGYHSFEKIGNKVTVKCWIQIVLGSFSVGCDYNLMNIPYKPKNTLYLKGYSVNGYGGFVDNCGLKLTDSGGLYIILSGVSAFNKGSGIVIDIEYSTND